MKINAAENSSVPKIEVIGFYSPRANVAEYEAFIQRYVDSLDPAKFSQETIEIFKRFGRLSELQQFDGVQAAAEITELLSNVVVIEVLVINADAQFSAAEFVQPDPSLKEGLWQVAWNETYFSSDGETVLSGYPEHVVPQEKEFRVVFYLHYWKSGLPIKSSYGELQNMELRPLPERLWRLAPYEVPD